MTTEFDFNIKNLEEFSQCSICLDTVAYAHNLVPCADTYCYSCIMECVESKTKIKVPWLQCILWPRNPCCAQQKTWPDDSCRFRKIWSWKIGYSWSPNIRWKIAKRTRVAEELRLLARPKRSRELEYLLRLMVGCIDGWVIGRVVGCINGWVIGSVVGCINGWVLERVVGCINGWVLGRVVCCIDGWVLGSVIGCIVGWGLGRVVCCMDGWVLGRVVGCKIGCILKFNLIGTFFGLYVKWPYVSCHNLSIHTFSKHSMSLIYSTLTCSLNWTE